MKQTTRIHHNLYKLFFIRAGWSFSLIMPIIGLYYTQNGLSVQDIFTVQIIFSIAIVVLEVPSGYFADSYGRKTALVLGTILGTIGFFVYSLGHGFWDFVVAELFLALFIGLVSGADSALLYDTLQETQPQASSSKYEGNMLAASRVSEAIAAVIGGLAATFVALNQLFLAEAAVYALIIITALTLEEIGTKNLDGSRKKPSMNMKQVVQYVLLENKRLRYLAVLHGVVSASSLCMVWFAQPYWSSIAVPVYFYGFIWAGVNILVAIAATCAHRLEQYMSFRALFLLFALSPMALYLATGALAGLWWSLVPLVMVWIQRGLSFPVFRDYINRQVPGDIRATVLSVNSLATRLIFSCSAPFLGWTADVWSFQAAFFASSLVFGVCALTAWLGLARTYSTETT